MTIVTSWILLPVFILALWGFLDIVFITIKFGVGPMPSNKKAIEKAVELVQREHKIIYDLGGGFGSTAKYFATTFPKKNIIMIEISYFSCCIARLYCRNLPNVKIKRQNFLSTTFQDDAYIYAYLYPSLMRDLSQQFSNWNGRFVSYTFSLRNRKENHVLHLSNKISEKLYVYDFIKVSTKK
jgi:hypothetical protein